MLTPADIIAAKLLVQLGDVVPDAARSHLRAVASDPDAVRDVVTRLYHDQAIEHQQVSRIRRYVAMYELVRNEAVYLRLLEREGIVPRQVVLELCARIERESYRRRIGAILVDMGRLTAEQDAVLTRKARSVVRKEDQKILSRYVAEDFDGVGRPLIPVKRLDPSVFKVSVIFRSRDTQAQVGHVLKRMIEEEARAGGSTPAAMSQSAESFIPTAPEQLDAATAEPDAGPSPGDTARFRLQPGVVSAARAAAAAPAAATPAAAVAPGPEEADDADGDGDATAEPVPGDLRSCRQIGPYNVVECLGQGGMGAVYLGREGESGAIVAIKVKLDKLVKTDDRARFEREIEVCSRLKHDNVVHLIDHGRTDDGMLYMVIPVYTGKELRDVLTARGGTLPLPEAFHIAEQVLDGLAHAHAQGLVHRDLKPENVFVLSGDERRIKLMDFGLARLMDDDKPVEERMFRTAAGVISGSPAYIAPESVSDEEIDGRTDVYSFGIMLFEMLTGRLPLFAETPYDYLREHLVGVPLTIFQGKKTAYWCPELEALMARMLAKKREDRPTCEQILAELRGGLRQRAIEQQANPPVEKKQDSLFNSFFRMLGG